MNGLKKVLALMLPLAVAMVVLPAVSAQADSGVVVSAHRGGAGVWPESSLVAYRSAIKAGVRELEGDVRVARDGTQLIYHDPALGAECDAAHEGLVIARSSWAQLSGARCHGEPLLRWDVLLSTVKSSKAALRIESKVGPGESVSVSRANAVRMARQIAAAGMTSRSLLQSFAWQSVTGAVHEVSPGLRVSALVTRPSFDLVRKAQRVGAYDVSYNAAYVNSYMNRFIRDHELVPVVWTVNKPADVRLAAASGVAVIISDDPVGARAALRSGSGSCVSQWVDMPNEVVRNNRFQAGVRQYPVIYSQRLASIKGLWYATFTVTASGPGTVDIAPQNSWVGHAGQRFTVTGSKTVSRAATVIPGDRGALRIFSDRNQQIKVVLNGYRVTKCR